MAERGPACSACGRTAAVFYTWPDRLDSDERYCRGCWEMVQASRAAQLRRVVVDG